MARLLPIVAVLLFALAYPRAALMVAVLATSATVVIVRYLMHHRTVFQVGGRAYA
jgi:hypothetical protein